jgi:SNF2 family DNA or RNA helicase
MQRQIDPQDYVFKTVPYEHQEEAFYLQRDKESFALLMEMGTGKSKVVIDTAAWNYGQGRIDALLVIAPNGVHAGWIDEQVPTHLPDYVPRVAATWVSSPRKAERVALERLWDPNIEGLRILAMNVEALSTDRGKKYFRSFLESFRTLLTGDESTRFKTPGAKRTKTLINLRHKPTMRRILSGAPVTQSPLDLYAPFKFLDPAILGHSTYTGFKHHYADWEERHTNTNRSGKFEALVQYKNLDELHRRIQPYSYRVRKEDCLDLPEKVYESRPVELGKEQRRVYQSLVTEGVAGLGFGELPPDQAEDKLWQVLLGEEEGDVVKAGNALTLQLRLMQVLGNWVKTDEGELVPIEKTNRRLETLLETLAETSGKVVIWAWFRHELEELRKALLKAGETVVEYHGGVGHDQKQLAKQQFPDPDGPRIFLGQHQAGIGLNFLTAASTMIYYNNVFSLDVRWQSEDRIHRIGQESSCTYLDLTAQGTLDERVVQSLQEKEQIANLVVDGVGLDKLTTDPVT